MSEEKTFELLLYDFLEQCRIQNFSKRTILDYGGQMRWFFDWMKEKFNIQTADRLTKTHLEKWQRYLVNRRTPKGLPMKNATIRLRIAVVRSFLKYLAQNDYIRKDMPDILVSPKEERMLPVLVLTHAQVRKMLSRIKTNTPLGCRDRAIVELLYTSGIRASELLGLNLEDIDLRYGTAKVLGKGRKERIVPIGKTALKHLTTYIKAIRPYQTKDDPNEQAVFISYQGCRLTYVGLLRMIHVYADKMGFDISVAPHVFRRSCTTELIKSGANVYHVKELLGHESLEMLRPYTKLTITDLKKTHEKCHPREREEQ